MFKSFDETKFRQAIKDKDYLTLKMAVINAIRNNPRFIPEEGFEKCEATRALQLLMRECPQIMENYCLLEGESPYDYEKQRSSWTTDTFIRASYRLKDNFNRERFNQVAQIGKYVYGERKTKKAPPQEIEIEGSQETKDCSLLKYLLPVGIIAGVALIVLVVILLAK